MPAQHGWLIRDDSAIPIDQVREFNIVYPSARGEWKEYGVSARTDDSTYPHWIVSWHPTLEDARSALTVLLQEIGR